MWKSHVTPISTILSNKCGKYKQKCIYVRIKYGCHCANFQEVHSHSVRSLWTVLCRSDRWGGGRNFSPRLNTVWLPLHRFSRRSRHCVNICCSEFHPDRWRNTENVCGNLCTPLSKVWLSLRRLLQNMRLLKPFSAKKSCSEFHENPTWFSCWY
jgi:hypothetical protein